MHHHKNAFASQYTPHSFNLFFLDLPHTCIIDDSPSKLFTVRCCAISLSATSSSLQIPTQQFPVPLQLHLPLPSRLHLLKLTKFVMVKWMHVFKLEKLLLSRCSKTKPNSIYPLSRRQLILPEPKKEKKKKKVVLGGEGGWEGVRRWFSLNLVDSFKSFCLQAKRCAQLLGWEAETYIPNCPNEKNMQCYQYEEDAELIWNCMVKMGTTK